MIIDPVCKMEVDEEEALIMEYNGSNYFFCSEGCRERFMKEHPENTRRTHYELIIIGGGPAGLTTAVYASTMRINTILITKDLGGQAYDSTKIQNYMGYDFVTGPELVNKFKEQLLKSHYIDHILTEVEKIERKDNGFQFKITTSELRIYYTNTIIFATGMSRRTLKVPGEERFQRKGLFYGNIQDYSFVLGEDVAVIGGGNSAMQIVENLHTIAKNIYLISDFELNADPAIIKQVTSYKNLKIYENMKTVRFNGKENIAGITARKKAEKKEITIPVRGVFISIGLECNSSLISHLVTLNEKKEVIINPDCSTSCSGIFAAGDVTSAFGKRIIIASGEGAKAALAARKHILNLRKK
ncbi:MAG: FAD-dependent oxidoreductase [Spirochaetes bacterium]|nr:FAD-dependent oxidoreductase [Spirochaetota bacterium]